MCACERNELFTITDYVNGKMRIEAGYNDDEL